MITRIELTNFMSHRHTVIEPAAGLTVLVGPNNCGKSAVVAALQILCRNENSTYVLRHGAKECSVQVHTDDGHVIQWRRRTSPSYRINNQVFDRLRGHGLPDELHQALRLPLVDGGGETDFDVHFGAQKSPIFLLGSSAANAARFFASSSDAIRLVAMQKRHKEKHAEAQREKNRLEAKSKRLAAELETLEAVTELDDRLAIVEQLFREIALGQAAIDEAQKLASHWTDQARVRDRHAGDLSVLARLTVPPAMAPVEMLAATIDSIDGQQRVQDHASQSLRALAALTAPPILQDVASLERLSLRISEQRGRVDRKSAECRCLRPLESPPILEDVAKLDELLRKLGLGERQSRRSAQVSSALESLRAPPKLGDEAALQRMLRDLDATTAEISRGEILCRALSGTASVPPAMDARPLAEMVDRLDRAAADEALRAKLLIEAELALGEVQTELCRAAEDSLCPVCGAELDPDRLLARAAAGTGGGHES